MKKICIAGCLCLALLLLLPGCAGKRTLTSVRLSEVTHSVFYAPQYVAMSQGFFREEGLDVELTNGGGADKVMTAVVSGQADMGLAGPEAAIYVMNQGKEDHPVILAQLTKRDGSFLVGRTPGPFSWDQVRGKTIIGGRAGGDDAGICAAAERRGAPAGRRGGHLGAVQYDGRGLYRRQRGLCDPV